MIKCSSLKYPPIKLPAKKPEFFISEIQVFDNEPFRTYSVYSIKDEKRVGTMSCYPRTIIKGDDVVNSVYVSDLFSFKRGVGTILLNYARCLSRQNGCKGNIHLIASGCYAPQRAPHIFYRKYGMNTGNKKLDKKMDRFIKQGKDARSTDFCNVLMYYPPVAYPKKNTIFHKFLRFIQNIFNSPQKSVAR